MHESGVGLSSSSVWWWWWWGADETGSPPSEGKGQGPKVSGATGQDAEKRSHSTIVFIPYFSQVNGHPQSWAYGGRRTAPSSSFRPGSGFPEWNLGCPPSSAKCERLVNGASTTYEKYVPSTCTIQGNLRRARHPGRPIQVPATLIPVSVRRARRALVFRSRPMGSPPAQPKSDRHLQDPGQRWETSREAQEGCPEFEIVTSPPALSLVPSLRGPRRFWSCERLTSGERHNETALAVFHPRAEPPR